MEVLVTLELLNIMDKKVVWDPMGNTKYCERVDVQLEEREEKKTKGLNMVMLSLVRIVWRLREIGEILKE